MSTFAPSGPTRGASSMDNGKSTLERLHSEAREILEQKAREIQDYNKVVTEAEEELAVLQAELKQKAAFAAECEARNSTERQEDNTKLIEDIKVEQQAEIERAEEKHRHELQKLQKQMQESLKTSEEWAEQRASVVLMEKTQELEEARKQLEQARKESEKSVFTAAQSRTEVYQQSKAVSMMNTQRLQLLEAQVSEITSITREELRDIKAKITDCLSAVDIKRKEHKVEEDRYEHELQEREHKYNSHLEMLREQFATEKERMEQAVQASQTKNENIQRILRQIERQNEKQLQTTLKDTERMKNTIYQTRAREIDDQGETRAFLTRINTIERECHQTEQEIQMVEQETKELLQENRLLKSELAKLDSLLYGTKRQDL